MFRARARSDRRADRDASSRHDAAGRNEDERVRERSCGIVIDSNSHEGSHPVMGVWARGRCRRVCPGRLDVARLRRLTAHLPTGNGDEMSYSLVQRKASFGLVETLPYVPPQTPSGGISWPTCPGEFVVVDAAGRPAGCFGDCPGGWERYTAQDPQQGPVHYCVEPGGSPPPSFNPQAPASPPGSGTTPAPTTTKPAAEPIAETQKPSTDPALMLLVGGGAVLFLGVMMFGD